MRLSIWARGPSGSGLYPWLGGHLEGQSLGMYNPRGTTPNFDRCQEAVEFKAMFAPKGPKQPNPAQGRAKQQRTETQTMTVGDIHPMIHLFTDSPTFRAHIESHSKALQVLRSFTQSVSHPHADTLTHSLFHSLARSLTHSLADTRAHMHTHAHTHTYIYICYPPPLRSIDFRLFQSEC